jgi:Cdc6-like AAA superfamily ATPase
MTWFEELGFDSDPFDTSPEASALYSVGLEQNLSELEYYVRSGSIVFVEGGPGLGKSVLLRMLMDRFGSKTVYMDCSLDKLNPGKIIKNKTSFLNKLLGRELKGVILVVDNIEGLSQQDMESLKYYYDNNYFGAVILAGKSFKSAGFPEALADRIGNRILTLSPLSDDDAVLLVRRRLGSTDLIGDDAVRKLYRMSGKNAKKFLELCSQACEKAVKSKNSKVTTENLDSLKSNSKSTDATASG